jgi:hypothetical protein
MRHRDPLTPEQERELDALDRALAGDAVDFDLRELEVLVREVRATAPEMSPGFAARLEHEVQEGFPTSRERQPLRGRGLSSAWTAKRWMLLPAAGSLAAVIVALVVVLGGGAGRDLTSGDQDTPSTAGREAAIPAAGAADSSTGGGSAAGGAGGSVTADRATAQPAPAAKSAAPSAIQASPAVPSPAAIAPARARKVERNAVLSLRTPDDRFEQTTDAVIATVARFDGIVATSQIGASDAVGGEATFDLRIPTARLDSALAALSKLGHVTERSQSLQDITASFTSAQARLTDARAERRGLLRALARATTQGQIDSVKARLRAVSGRISGLKGQLASLRRRADLSRVDLTVRGGGQSGTTGGGGDWTPGDAAGDALRVLEVLAGIALVALAVLAPVGLLGAAVALAVRSGRRRRREGALDPA